MNDIEIVFMAGVLEHLLAGIDLVPRNERRPWPGPRRGIGNGELVVDGIRRHTSETLGDRERRRIGAEEQHALLGLEVRRLDDERRSIPVAARITKPLAQPL